MAEIIITQITSDPGWLGWAAGILDGEGSIGIYRKTNLKGRDSYVVSFQLANTDLRMVQKFRELFPVNNTKIVTQDNRTNIESLNKLPMFKWAASGKAALTILEAIRPYLITKAEQADVVIAFLRHVGAAPRPYLGNPITDTDMATRQKMWEDIRHIKGIEVK